MNSKQVASGTRTLIGVSAAVVSVARGSFASLLLCSLVLVAIDLCLPLLSRTAGDFAKVVLRDLFQLEVASAGRDASVKSIASVPASAPLPAQDFVVCQATPRDAAALTDLYERGYVTCHRNMHRGSAACASLDDWRNALGRMDFEEVLCEVFANKGTGDVRILKCAEEDAAGTPGRGRLVGYVLYELREKGPKTRRQRFCELVNIVVSAEHRGCGAGKKLFEALCADLASSAAVQATDIRLFVAERNAGPLAWYRRLGFENAGWQSEQLGSAEVKFLRMVRRTAPHVSR